ncbi:hypothetical protein TUMEXPCC7403_25210 [Tumidithrix helvetica PCC 7403]|uniref:hypothetical protein n=1 Tax=Tumidithrix helvetica TaxID=3457545 RepID=UPI003CAC5EED
MKDSYKYFTTEDRISIEFTLSLLQKTSAAVKSCEVMPAQRLVYTVLEHAIADCQKVLKKSDQGVK